MDLNVQAILKAARRAALKEFGKYPDFEERLNDVQSVAWELSLTASEKATPGSIVHYAVKRVTIRRQFHESLRCLETIPKGKQASRSEFRRVAWNVKDYATRRDDPAELAAFRIDAPAWFASLPPVMRQAAQMLAVGEKTGTVAKRLDLSPSRISQIRQELAENWIAVHS